MDVFIADDSAIVRERIAGMLADIDGIRVVGEAGDIRAAVTGVTELRPHTVILDVELPGGTGIDVLKAIAGLRPKPRVIMLTNNPQPAYREQCLRAGAEFFFDKTLEFEKVAQVLRVLRGSLPESTTNSRAPANAIAAANRKKESVSTRPRRAQTPNAIADPDVHALLGRVTLLARQICNAAHAQLQLANATEIPWLSGAGSAHAKESLLYAALCEQVRREDAVLVIEDLSRDPRSRGVPPAGGDGPARFFAGVPLVLGDGYSVGALAVTDPDTRTLTDIQQRALQALARQTVDSLELLRSRYEVVHGTGAASSRPATRDVLTGLQNRAALHESMLRGIAHASRHAEKLAFLYIDIDNFRQFNNTSGRAAGDALLVEAGKRLQAVLRGADTVARLGGDEFAVLALGLRGHEDAVLVAQKLHRALSLPFNAGGNRWMPSCSIGVSVFPHDGADGESLLRHADKAMYRAKSGGHGGFELYAAPHRRH